MQFYEYEIISFVIVMYWLHLALSAALVVLRTFAGSDPYSHSLISERKAGYNVFRVWEKLSI